MIEKRIIPISILKHYVDSFWISKAFKHDTTLTLLPGTGSELYFIQSGAFIQKNKRLKNILFISLRNRRADINVLEGTVVMAARFKFNAIRHFTNEPISSLFDNLMNAHCVFGDTCKSIGEDISLQSDFDSKIETVSRFLLNQLQQYKKKSLIDTDELKAIYYNPDKRKILEISRDNNLSIRQFEKRFKDEVGISAKDFQTLSRFQKVVKYCITNKTAGYLKSSLDWGYYDQSHFIRDFRKKTQMKPSDFFTESNFSTHFYNP